MVRGKAGGADGPDSLQLADRHGAVGDGAGQIFSPGGSEPNFIKERVLLQGQWGEIVEEREDSFIYEITVNGTQEIKPWLRSFGSSCEVLEPVQLRRELIAEWKEIRAYYESV